MIYRQEIPQDIDSVQRVNNAAFERSNESAIITGLREAGAVTLSMVAEKEGQIVGNAIFSPATLENSKRSRQVVAMGPVAVHPDVQRSGVGTGLIQAALECLREQEHRIAVVLGHASYYPRFGFEPSVKYRIRSQWDVPDEVFMALALVDGALDHAHGTVKYHAAFG
jgi:putative acetyltransferase